MGFRIQRRLNFGAGLGLNLSKSGASPSFRSRAGAISTKGISIRTGIPGFSFRGSWGKGAEGAVFGLIAMLLVLAINISCVLISVGLKILFIVAGLTVTVAWFLLALTFNLFAWVALTACDFVNYLIDKRKGVVGRARFCTIFFLP